MIDEEGKWYYNSDELACGVSVAVGWKCGVKKRREWQLAVLWPLDLWKIVTGMATDREMFCGIAAQASFFVDAKVYLMNFAFSSRSLH